MQNTHTGLLTFFLFIFSVFVFAEFHGDYKAAFDSEETLQCRRL